MRQWFSKAPNIKITIFWNETPCSFDSYLRAGRKHQYDQCVSRNNKMHLIPLVYFYRDIFTYMHFWWFLIHIIQLNARIWNYQNNLQDSTTSTLRSCGLNTTVCFHTKYFMPVVQVLNEQPLERSRSNTTKKQWSLE